MIRSTRGLWRASAVALAFAAVAACGDQKASVLDTTTTIPPVPTEGPSLASTTLTTTAPADTSTIITVPPTVPPPPTTCKPCNVPTVPPPPSTNKDDTTTADASSSSSATTAPTHQTYTVKNGDTLGGIAATFHTTVSALMALNGISNPDSIYAGEVLKVS